MEPKIAHLVMIPWTGLGLYNGFRGNRWLSNRIKIFKQFVLPSLLNQSNKNFKVWCCWRREERHNPIVKDYVKFMATTGLEVVHTYAGIPFFDDKYADEVARERLINAIHGSMGELFDLIGEAEYVYMTIQPSDDCYHKSAVNEIQDILSSKDVQGCGFTQGYICNYLTKEISEYNPTTNPPFYTVKFSREDFFDPLKHLEFTALKFDVGKYKKGTACPSHEYIGNCINYVSISFRGFLVGCHTENVSTYYNHPFKGKLVGSKTLDEFGIANVPLLKLKFSIRKWVMRKLPYSVRRKLRYLWGEKLYNFLRS